MSVGPGDLLLRIVVLVALLVGAIVATAQTQAWWTLALAVLVAGQQGDGVAVLGVATAAHHGLDVHPRLRAVGVQRRDHQP